MRLALASPLPPLPTGIADYTADLVQILSPGHEIELFHGQEDVDLARFPADVSVHRASELVARHGREPFDVTVYQMGNAPAHDFLYEVVPRLPGLLVLHDLVLHHARAARFLESDAVRAWRACPGSREAREGARPVLEAWHDELAYEYPAAGDRLFAAHLGTVGDLLPYAYPLFRMPVEASRAVAVHNGFMAAAVRAEVPGALVLEVPMPAAASPVAPEAVRDLRARLGLVPEDIVVGCFGRLTPEKRVLTVARAVARALARDPRLRLLLVGPVPERGRLEADLDRLGVRPSTIVTGRVPLDDLPAYLEATDLVAHLRYPTARETSAALLRALAQGRPTVVSDLEQQRDLPDEAVARVDITEEEDGLVRWILELARDPDRRARLGAAAADHVRREHAPSRVRAAWEEALQRTRDRSLPPPRGWPAHWPRGAG